LNNALPALTSIEAVEVIEDGEEISIDLAKGEIHCKAGVYKFPPLPEVVMKIFDSGGLIPYTRKILESQK
jgi:3-isopropylmalate/(R)-2-methylmalate dehydratase small subunit